MKFYNLPLLCLIGSALAAKRDDDDDNVDVSALLADIGNIIDEIKATYGIEERGTDGLVVRQDDLVTTLTDLVSVLGLDCNLPLKAGGLRI
ncbi:hypothetical protein PENOC_046770 [Penicillium occitanis (nom. inval.)]|nr:hypothetical protein PENOC_046770 [Penicillium occitanis (nom. inval.)]